MELLDRFAVKRREGEWKGTVTKIGRSQCGREGPPTRGRVSSSHQTFPAMQPKSFLAINDFVSHEKKICNRARL